MYYMVSYILSHIILSFKSYHIIYIHIHTHICTAKFWGFKENSAEFRSFIFTDPKAEPTTTSATTTTTSSSSTTPASSSASSNNTIQNTTSQIGQIKVIIHEAILKDGLFDNKCGKPSSTPLTNDPTNTSNTNNTNTNTKFWMQPSVGTSAGRAVTGKDEFKPVAKWENKSSIPTQTILLKYHTQLNYDLLYKHSLQLKTRKLNEPQLTPSSTIPLLKRMRYDEQTNTVDLTTDDDDGHNSDPLSNSNKTSNLPKITMNTGTGSGVEASESQTPFEEEVVNDEVTLVRVPKIIPFADMTNEEAEPQWSSCTVDR